MSNRPLAVAKSRLPTGAKPPATTTRATPLDQPLSYEEREIRNRAARVLENEEMLLLLSRQRHEVIHLSLRAHASLYVTQEAKIAEGANRTRIVCTPDPHLLRSQGSRTERRDSEVRLYYGSQRRAGPKQVRHEKSSGERYCTCRFWIQQKSRFALEQQERQRSRTGRRKKEPWVYQVKGVGKIYVRSWDFMIPPLLCCLIRTIILCSRKHTLPFRVIVNEDV